MKSTGIFIAALLGISLLTSTAMLVTATMKPEWFMFGAKHGGTDPLQAQAKKDSTAQRDTLTPAPADSAAITTNGTHPAAPAQVEPAQGTQGSQASVLQQHQAAGAVPPSTQSAALAKEDDLQNLVKLYEAMKPETAARILGKMQDKEVRSVLLHIKKQQAAKILAYFDANRAAQILAP